MVSYTLDQIVREYLIELGDVNLNRYPRVLQYGISGLRELQMDVSGTPTSVILPVTDTDIVNLPNDYINYTRIAIPGTDGQLHSLGVNPNMSLKRDYTNCGVITKDTGTNTGTEVAAYLGWEWYTDNFRNGEFTGKFFGLGGGNNVNGYYRIDLEHGVIQLSEISNTTTHIFLEYISNLNSVNGNFMVHPFILESLKAWIYWKSIERNRTYGLGEKQMAQQNYMKAYANSLARFNSATFEEWNATFRRSTMLTPKY